MNVITIDGTQEIGIKRENEDFYKSRKKKQEEAAASTSGTNGKGVGVLKDPVSGLRVDLSSFQPVSSRLQDNIKSMYAVEVLKSEGMGQTTLKQTHVYIRVQPDVQADQQVNTQVIRSFTPGKNGQPHAIKNTRSIFKDIQQTLDLVDETNKETLDRNLERENALDAQGTCIEQRRMIGESVGHQLEYFIDNCKLIGLGTNTPAEVLARMILTGGVKF